MDQHLEQFGIGRGFLYLELVLIVAETTKRNGAASPSYVVVQRCKNENKRKYKLDDWVLEQRSLRNGGVRNLRYVWG